MIKLIEKGEAVKRTFDALLEREKKEGVKLPYQGATLSELARQLERNIITLEEFIEDADEIIKM